MKFGSVEKTIKSFLIFFGQTFPKAFPPFMLGFQNMTERHYCPAHISSQARYLIRPRLKQESEDTHHMMSCQGKFIWPRGVKYFLVYSSQVFLSYESL